jgi:methyl-accepting chemotaxis protein
MQETQFGRGISTATTTDAATAEAVDDARDQLGESTGAALAIALIDPEYDAEAVIDGIQDAVGSVPVIGATTAGEFTETQVAEGGIVIALLGSDGLSATTALAGGVGEDTFSTVQSAIGELPPAESVAGTHTAAVTFHNGLAGKGEEITLITNQLLDGVPLAGGSAGDALDLEQTTVFTEDGVSDDGVAIALLGSETPFGLAANHGHTPLSDTYEVTDADENVVYELDGEPAFEVWQREIADIAAEEYGVDVDSLSDGGDELADMMTKFELGLPTGDDEHKIRWPGLTTSTDDTLRFATGVPEGSAVRIMHSPPDDQIESAAEAANQALDDLDGSDPAGALVFDCVCRGLILGDEFDTAVDAIASEIGVPLAGFETYGEVCMEPDASSGYHNTTTSILLL